MNVQIVRDGLVQCDASVAWDATVQRGFLSLVADEERLGMRWLGTYMVFSSRPYEQEAVQRHRARPCDEGHEDHEEGGQADEGHEDHEEGWQAADEGHEDHEEGWQADEGHEEGWQAADEGHEEGWQADEGDESAGPARLHAIPLLLKVRHPKPKPCALLS